MGFRKSKIKSNLDLIRQARRNAGPGFGQNPYSAGACFALAKCDAGDNPQLDTKRDPKGGTTCEVVLSNASNANIVLGRDRPGSIVSGYGGRGDTHCASIDIVAGRMAYAARTVTKNAKGQMVPITVNPDFKSDAARIYISQKTDVDKNFRLAEGSMPFAVTRSAVAIKADGIRLVAREGIKLVTGVDQIHSQGHKINNAAYGIDLIANNDDSDLQPIPKGDNLIEALGSISRRLDELNGALFSFLITQMQYNLATQLHTHNSPFFGIPVGLAPSLQIMGPKTAVDQFNQVFWGGIFPNKMNIMLHELNYLWPSGKKYPLSSYNNTN